MAQETYSFEITAELAKVRQDLNKFAQETQQQLDKLNTKATISSFRDSIDIAKEFGSVLQRLFADPIAQAIEADTATRQLANAMRITGEYTQAASDYADEYAKKLAQVTVYSDNQVVSALALAKSYQLTNAESRKLVAAATDLAAITGQDLNSAVRQLAETYSGHLRELQKQFPELKKFTDAQLRSGAAVDFLAQKLKGSAAEALNSYAGQTAQARKTVEKFEEDVGNFLLRSIAVYVRWGKAVVKEISTVSAENQKLLAQMDNTSIFDKVSGAYERIRKERVRQDAEAEADKAAINRRNQEAAEAAAKAELETFKHSFVDRRKEILLHSMSEREQIEQKFQDDAVVIARGYGLRLIKDQKEFLDLIYGLKKQQLEKEVQLQNRIRSEAEAAEAKFDAERKKRYEDSVKEPIKQIIEFGAALNKDQALGVGVGLMQSIVKGASGAKDLLAKGIGSALSTALTGTDALAGPFSEIIGVLSEGPEKTKQMVAEFARAIPELIKNLAESLPVLIETLVRELPPALAKTMPTVAIGFTTALIAHIPDILKGFYEGMKEIPGAIIEAIKQGIGEVGKSIGSLGGLLPTSGGAGGILGTIAGFGSGIGAVAGGGIGFLADTFFAEGGQLPDEPSKRGDKYHVRADAGELFIDRSTTQKLKNFLDGAGQGGGGSTTVILRVGEQELARVLLNLERGGFRTA